VLELWYKGCESWGIAMARATARGHKQNSDDDSGALEMPEKGGSKGQKRREMIVACRE
jgi:hypothetical protein